MKKTSCCHVLLWIVKIAMAGVLLWAASGKLMGAEQAVGLFSLLGVEPRGRIVTGLVEVTAAIMLLIPSIAWLGALLAGATMIVAVGLHLGPLGINEMFYVAIAVLAGSIFVFGSSKRAGCCAGSCSCKGEKGTCCGSKKGCCKDKEDTTETNNDSESIE